MAADDHPTYEWSDDDADVREYYDLYATPPSSPESSPEFPQYDDVIEPSAEERLAAAVVQDDVKTIVELEPKVDDTSLAYAEAITHNRTQQYPILALKTLSFALPFERAAAKGDLDLVQILVQKAPEARGVAAGVAAEKGHIYVTDYLMELGGVDESMVLYGAAKGGRLPLVKMLLESMESWDVIRQTFIQACTGGHLETIKFMYHELDTDDGAAPAIKTGLRRAAEHGHIDAVKWLLGQVLSEVPNFPIESILLEASRSGSPELVSYLLTFDLDNIQEALDQAVNGGKREIIELILTHIVGNIPESTLVRIIRRGDVEGVDRFINSSNAIAALNAAWSVRNWRLVKLCRGYNDKTENHVNRLLYRSIDEGDVTPFKQIESFNIDVNQNHAFRAIQLDNQELTAIILSHIPYLLSDTIMALLEKRWCKLVEENVNKAPLHSDYFILSLTNCPTLSPMLADYILESAPVVLKIISLDSTKALGYVREKLDSTEVSNVLLDQLRFGRRPVQNLNVFLRLIAICDPNQLLAGIVREPRLIDSIYPLIANRIDRTDVYILRNIRTTASLLEPLLPKIQNPDNVFRNAMMVHNYDLAEALTPMVRDKDEAFILAIQHRQDVIIRMLLPHVTNYYDAMIVAGRVGMKSLFEELMVLGTNKVYDVAYG